MLGMKNPHLFVIFPGSSKTLQSVERMTQIFKVPSNSVPVIDSAPPPVSDFGRSVRITGFMVIAACLLMIAPAPAYTNEITAVPTSVAAEQRSIDDEDPDIADDGSRALRDSLRAYNLEEIEPISAKEEEALLGNWGDTDAEDGD